MNSLLMAALLTCMTSSGGANLRPEANAQPGEPSGTWEGVRKDFDALRTEISTLEVAYGEALERRKADAQRQQEVTEYARRGR